MNPRKLPIMRLLEGNPGRRDAYIIGVEAFGQPEAPEHLSYDARQCFDAIRRSMPPAVYAELDTPLLAAFAMAWAVHKRAATEVAAQGFRYVDEGRPSPWLKIMNAQAAVMLTLGCRLGLNPLARASLSPPAARREASKFCGLIEGAALEGDPVDAAGLEPAGKH